MMGKGNKKINIRKKIILGIAILVIVDVFAFALIIWRLFFAFGYQYATFPEGAGREFATAIEKAVVKCGEDVYLLKIRRQPSAGKVEYGFSGGDCGPQPDREIEIECGLVCSDPVERRLGADSSLPISLSDWRISWRQAIEIAGPGNLKGNLEGLHLYNRGDVLIWDVSFRHDTRYMSSDHVYVNATTGEIISRRTITPTL